MTFDEVRKRQLETLDGAYQELRAVVADPKWTVIDKDSKCEDACRMLSQAINRIGQLNQVESEAK